jgi:hypothetical protein
MVIAPSVIFITACFTLFTPIALFPEKILGRRLTFFTFCADIFHANTYPYQVQNHRINESFTDQMRRTNTAQYSHSFPSPSSVRRRGGEGMGDFRLGAERKISKNTF